MNIELELVVTVIIAIIGSNALWGFIQFLLERKDKKSDCSKKILEAIQKLNAKIDERSAIGCRIRILKFMDEIILIILISFRKKQYLCTQYGKRQDSIRLFQLRSGVTEVDREMSGLRTVEHL